MNAEEAKKIAENVDYVKLAEEKISEIYEQIPRHARWGNFSCDVELTGIERVNELILMEIYASGYTYKRFQRGLGNNYAEISWRK